MGKLKYVLFVMGFMLCVIPIMGKIHSRSELQKAVSEYKEHPNESNAIGILKIPRIHAVLPIYCGTSEEVLQKGIGHIQESSLPGGGESTHCLLAGHRGLPDATLLARLGEVEKGDAFYIEVNDKRYAYQVFEITVVRPEDTKGLGIQKGRDLVSLITCTPYGMNTHRLIVTGERMEAKE